MQCNASSKITVHWHCQKNDVNKEQFSSQDSSRNPMTFRRHLPSYLALRLSRLSRQVHESPQRTARWTAASPAMGHWNTCLLDVQLFRFFFQVTLEPHDRTLTFDPIFLCVIRNYFLLVPSTPRHRRTKSQHLTPQKTVIT